MVSIPKLLLCKGIWVGLSIIASAVVALYVLHTIGAALQLHIYAIDDFCEK